MSFSQHRLSAAYPAMATDEFQSLKDSIEIIGVQTPVTLFEGQVLDGWHRWTAALELGMACPTAELGDVDPRDFVRAVNGKSRRHLTQSQLAAAEVALWGWAPVGKPNVAPGATLATNAQMAAAAGVSPRTIRDAKAVASKATPDVKAAVKDGTMSVKEAAATTKPPKPAKAKPAKTAPAAPPERDDAPTVVTPAPAPAPGPVTFTKPAKPDPEPQAPDLAALVEEVANLKERLSAMVAEAESLTERLDECTAMLDETLADNEILAKVVRSSDPLGTAIAEIKSLKAQVAQLREAQIGLMNGKNEAIRLAKSWKRKAEAVR